MPKPDEDRKPKPSGGSTTRPRPSSNRPAGYAASQNPVAPRPRTPTRPTDPGYIDFADQDRARTTGMNRGSFDYGSTVAGQDQWNNMTPDEYFAALMGATGVNAGAGGGGGGRGGGGGAAPRPTDPDPLGWNSIAQVQALNEGYAAMLAAMDAKNKAVMGGFDSRTAGLNSANDMGRQNLDRLLADITAQAGNTRGQVASSYAAGDQQLAGLQNQYAQMIAARQPAMSQTLSAFGADPAAAVSSPNGVQDMMMAQRANLARVGQADDALFANRSNVYTGLNQDVTTQRQMAFDNLMAKLLADRQAAEQQGAMERAQLAMQQQQQALQLAAQEQTRRAQYV